ncbi:MAG: S9 family peptidase [Anaerolineae bacterium]|nr:S9 family peptidase [Gloeobacterales cyanobacterium ES-bin-313]
MKRWWICALLSLPLFNASGSFAESPRPILPSDVYKLRTVADPQVSPDGQWVAYTVSTADPKADRNNKDLWMTSWDSKSTIQLTTSKKNESTPRWSPDNRYLAFLSSRDDDNEVDQVWLLDRQGGEAKKLTNFKGGVEDLVWSPDGKRLALIVDDPEPEPEKKPKDNETEDKDSSDEKKAKKPIVIDRFQFKQDVEGYLGKQRKHLTLFDLVSRKATPLLTGDTDEFLPAWSPDSSTIAFVSKRRPEADRSDNWDLYTIAATSGATPKQLTSFAGQDNNPDWDSYPAWSPDGSQIAYLQGGLLKLIGYAVHKLAIIPSAGGPEQVLTAKLDRNVQSPLWSSDGKAITFLLEDDRTVQLASLNLSSNEIRRLIPARQSIDAFDINPQGRTALLLSTPQAPPEIFALESNGTERQLSKQNADWLADIKIAATEEISFKSKDGTQISGFIVTPPNYQAGKRYPTLLRIHGGPVGQFANEFAMEWQVLAAHGYVVVAANPRGSSGRGEDFSKAIYADWGNKDAQDVLAAVDTVVSRGMADPERLGIGGWSYGGMLTNYTIAQDTRFKVAISGASIANILAGYGTDQYIRDYEEELGKPWEHPEVWMRISFPFFHADRIVTPTLFMCGEKDFNVPLLNSEQMYQALRSLGRDTKLIIYPDQFHGLTRPSYKQDRFERYLAWYDKYLKP